MHRYVLILLILLSSAGSSAGQTMVRDIDDRPIGSRPGDSIVLDDGRVVFTTRNAESGRDVWITDGTTGGTRLLYSPVDNSNLVPYGTIHALRGDVLFRTRDPDTWLETAWRLNPDDGTLSDVPGIDDRDLRRLITSDDIAYFVLEDDVADVHTLWSLHADSSDASRLEFGAAPHTDWISDLIVVGDSVYVHSISQAGRTEFWAVRDSGANLELVYATEDGSIWDATVVNGNLVYAGRAAYGAALELFSVPIADSEPLADANLLTDLVAAGEGLDTAFLGSTGEFTILFVAPYDNSSFLLLTDGTEEGTHVVQTLTKDQWPGRWIATDTHIFFDMYAPGTGIELWASDGSPEGTGLLRDINPGGGSSRPEAMAVVSNHVYFCANDGQSGFELWTSDGTAPGTQLIADILPGGASSNPGHIVPLNDELFVAANDGVAGAEPWAIGRDGSGLRLLRDIRSPDRTSSGLDDESSFVHHGDVAVFVARDSQGRDLLWESDGTHEGTGIFEEDTQPELLREPDFLAGSGAISYWAAAPESWSRGDLYRLDMANRSFTPLIGMPDQQLEVTRVVIGPDEILFTADLDSIPNSVWISDGTQSGTQPIYLPEYTWQPTELGAWTYFNGRWLIAVTRGERDRGIYPWDGTWLSSESLTDGKATYDRLPEPGIEPVPIGDRLLFFDDREDLWVTDGTVDGTSFLVDYIHHPTDGFVAVGDTAYWGGNDLTRSGQKELLRSDGTLDGTGVLVRLLDGGSDPRNLVSDGSRMFFSTNGDDMHRIWSSDGTAAGTIEVLAVPTGMKEFRPHAFHEGRLIFTVETSDLGEELWMSAGRPESTILLADLDPGPGDLSVEPGTVVKDRYLFSAVHPETGRELWSIDLSAISIGREERADLPGTAAVSALWPNPAHQTAAMEIESPKSERITIEAFDVLGRRVGRVYSGVAGGETGSRIDIDTSGWAAGMYVLRVKAETFSTTRTLIRAR